MTRKITTLVTAGILATGAAYADCGPTLQEIRINDIELKPHNGELTTSFTIDISDIDLGKNQQIIYTPGIRSAKGDHAVYFGHIIVNGRNTDIREQRQRKKPEENSVTTVRQNGTTQYVSYTGTIPYESWMENGSLVLNEDLCGCGDLTSQNSTVLTPVNPSLYDVAGTAPSGVAPAAKDMVMIFAEAEKESPKIRHAEGSAYIDFPVNKTNINRDYHDNRSEINEILQTIELVKNNPNVQITDIEIHGYASPEGSYSHNKYLAQARAKSLTDYVKSLAKINPNVFSVTSTPEDWDGLIAILEESDLPDRYELIEIAKDNYLTPDEKEKRMKSQYRHSYDYMLENWFPYLRRSDYNISYSVRVFTPQEALEVIKVSPEDVSVYEMYSAAQLLGKGSQGYNDIVKLAAKTYPEDEVANYNAAVVSLHEGDNKAALSYLDKMGETADALNLRGVIAATEGDFAKAAEYFRSAAAQGLNAAQQNLNKLEQYAN